jgi:hypothetical protein
MKDLRKQSFKDLNGDPANYFRTLNEMYEQKTTESLDLPLKLKQIQQKRMKIKLKKEKES